MSREIKFRAWLRVENDFNDEGYKMIDDLAFEEYLPVNDQLASVKHLMQYTGLKDNNGKEIYEGDIVKYNFWNKSGIGYVTFENGAFGINQYSKDIEIYYHNPFSSWDEPEKDCLPFIEVIGNIYQNPELLETVQK